MHSFLIQSFDPKKLANLDTLIIEPETSIGIEEVRQIQSFLSRKPTQSKHNQVYINQAHLLTVPAQNALLKTLEEPPGNSLIYLVTTQPDTLLPTILSRVQIEKTDQLDSKREIDTTKTLEIISKLQGMKPGEKMALVDSLGFTKEEALNFINELEHILHADLSVKIDYHQIVLARKYLKANVNTKLVLDNCFLSI